MNTLVAVASIALLLVAGTNIVAADEHPTRSAQEAGSVISGQVGNIEAYLEYLDELQADLQSGALGRVHQRDLDLITTSRNTLVQVLADKSSIDELSRDERIAVYNAQEAISAALKGSAESRPICRRQHTVGTHRQVVACFTVQERREMRENAERIWSFGNQSSLMPPGDG